jgi:hypothetical protein
MDDIEQFIDDLDSIILAIDNKRERIYYYDDYGLILKTTTSGNVYGINKHDKILHFERPKR